MVRLPGAMPAFFSGLRIGATYSVAGAIVGEYVGAYQGLGIYMQLSTNSHAIAPVFAAIVVTTVLSLLLFGFVSLIEWIMLPWAHRSLSQMDTGPLRAEGSLVVALERAHQRAADGIEHTSVGQESRF
jgi:hypothetical protein